MKYFLMIVLTIILTAQDLVLSLGPIVAANGETQCGNYLVRSAGGGWRVNVKGQSRGSSIEGSLQLELLDKQSEPQLLFYGAQPIYRPTPDQASDGCVSSIPRRGR